MICFFTSSPVIPGGEELNPANRFLTELKKVFSEKCSVLFICSDPEEYDKTDFFAAATRRSFENSGYVFSEFIVVDARNDHQVECLIKKADLIILAGGHVPTQNRYFNKIGLKKLLKEYSGILLGISAGSMNSAEIVYAQPEREGEAADPEYQRFLPGLGLTKTMLLPHYQMTKDDVLDGQRIFADIACKDSMGRKFYAIPDGTYLLIREGRQELHGEAWLITDGMISQIAEEDDITQLS